MMLVLLVGLLVAGPAAAQDGGEQADAENTEGENAEGENAEGQGEGEESAEGEQQANTGSSLRRGNRMEFDARLIRGESAGSGAVFLFQRAQRPLPSMIKKRTSFLRDTVGSVLGDDWATKFDKAQTDDSDSD